MPGRWQIGTKIAMPTYEYRCHECGHEFEEFQKMTADPLVVCPSCGKHTLKRVMGTGGGLIFKGSGFYLTDYKKNGSSPATSSAKGKTESKSTENKTSETTPAPVEKKSMPPPKNKE